MPSELKILCCVFFSGTAGWFGGVLEVKGGLGCSRRDGVLWMRWRGLRCSGRGGVVWVFWEGRSGLGVL